MEIDNNKHIQNAKRFLEDIKRGKKPDSALLRDISTLTLNLLPKAAVLGTPLFSAIWRQSVMATVEPVCFRENKNQIEIFLTIRSRNESYPGCLHVCGTPIRSSDEKDFNFIADRLAINEYKIKKGKLKLQQYQPVDVKIVEEERGPVLSLAFLAKLIENPSEAAGNWYAWDKIKKNNDLKIVPYHRDWLIPTALKYWKK